MISTKPGAIARINRALAARYNVAWLSFLQDARGFSDVAGDAHLGAAGSQIDGDEGSAFRFSGSQSAQTGLVLPSSYEQIAVVARIRSTGSQGGNPGQAFGVANLGGVQCSIGVGYDSAGTAVGATVLHGNGATAVSTRSASIGTWYTVVAQGAFGTGSPVRAWVDGVPNTSGTNGGSGGAANTVVIGSQTRSAGTLRWFTGDVLWAAVLVGDTPFWVTDEIAADMWAQDFPYNVIAPSRTIWVPVSAGGAVTLVIQDATHSHSADSPALTTDSTLAVGDAAHGHSADSVTIGTGLALATDDAAHAHAADAGTLTTGTSLATADASHAHAADAATLSTNNLLAVDDVLHGHAADNIDLSGAPYLVIADALHAHTADGVALTTEELLVIASALHAHLADNVTFGSSYSDLELIYRILTNRQELDASTGVFRIYDDDGVTVLLSAAAWADAAGTIPYSGGALARIDALA